MHFCCMFGSLASYCISVPLAVEAVPLCVEYPLLFSGWLASWTATPTMPRLHAGEGALVCFPVTLLTAVNTDLLTDIWGGSPQIYACLSCSFPSYVSTESYLLFWHGGKKFLCRCISAKSPVLFVPHTGIARVITHPPNSYLPKSLWLISANGGFSLRTWPLMSPVPKLTFAHWWTYKPQIWRSPKLAVEMRHSECLCILLQIALLPCDAQWQVHSPHGATWEHCAG